MKNYTLLKLFAGFLLLAISCLSAEGQWKNQVGPKVTINFTELPVGLEVAERYVDKGVLLSSQQGRLISQEYLSSGRTMGLCASVSRNFLGVWLPYCADTYIGFVLPSQKMVRTFARNIEIRLSGDAGVFAYWYDDKGNIKTQKASPRSNNEMGFSIPDKTEGVLLIDENKDCDACMILTTSVSFDPLVSIDAICEEPTTDAGFSWRRLANESYSQTLYDRLDEYRNPKPNPTRPILFQYLKAGKETYYDEFAIIVKLPKDDQDFAQKIFADMRRKLDEVGLGQPATNFQNIGSFSYFEPAKIAKRPDKLPIVGDMFRVDINPGLGITGIDDGDVMMTELMESPRHSYFRYSTLTNTLSYGPHPNNGSREYGYFKTLDGLTKFYVRGVDQFRVKMFVGLGGKSSQDEFWMNFIEGIGNRIKFYKGEVIYPATKTVNESLKTVPNCHVAPKSGYGT